MAMSTDQHRETEAQLNKLLVHLCPAVKGYFMRRVRSMPEAEELTQEVMARILKRAETGPIENVEGYVFSAAANLLRERGRQASLRDAAQVIEISPELLDSDEVKTPERILIGRQALRSLVDSLNELPERTRTVFVLCRFEEMKGPEVARRLGISISAVEKHMMRAMAHIRTCAR
jgi:RNA polymerase sigma factor (sigma-70 family)